MKRLLLAFGLLMSIKAEACECNKKPALDSAIQQSDKIVLGKILKKEYVNTILSWPSIVIDPDSLQLAESPQRFATLRYTIGVYRFYKGHEKSKKIVVYSDLAGGLCGVDFELGKSYFIYTYGDSCLDRNNHPIVRNFTTTCTRTTLYSKAEKRLLEVYFKRK